MKKFHSLFTSIFIAAVLVACGSKLTQKNFDKIANDMNPKQVKAILGEPTSMETTTVPIVDTEITTYKYRDKYSEAEIIFRDNKVNIKTGSFSSK